MAAGDPVAVDVNVDLRKFRAAVKAYDNELQKGTRRELAAVARWGRDVIRADVPVGAAAGGHAYTAYTSGTDGFTPYVQFDRAKVPYVGWLDFGGQLPSKRSGKPARVIRERKPDGRYFYPGLIKIRPEARDKVVAVLKDAARTAGLD